MGRRVKIASLLWAVLIPLCVLMIGGCGGSLLSVVKDITKEDQVSNDKTALQITFTGGDSAANVTGNLVLPASGPNGTTIAWSSSDPSIVSAAGVVTQPATTTVVTLTATITLGSTSITKVFTVTVLQAPVTDAQAVAADKAGLQIAFSGSDSSSSVTGNLTLPTTGSSGTTISWSSSDPSIVSATGSVTRPTSTTVVTLTATISKGGTSDTKAFPVTVLMMPPTDALSVAADKATLQIVYASGDSSTSVTGNLTLPTAGSSGTTVSWVSDHPSIVSATGAVTRPVSAATDVTLTATISKGTASDIKQFVVTVVKAAAIGLSPSSLSFSATAGGANPAQKTVSVTNTGGGVLSGLGTSISYNGTGGWLTASLDVTVAPATLTLMATTGSLAAGNYSATVSVASPNAGNSPQTVSVAFSVAGYTLTVQAGQGGSISAPSGGAAIVTPGAATSIAASADTNYSFTNWTVVSGLGVSFGNANSSSTTVTLTNGDATIKANFALTSANLVVQAVTGGSIAQPAGGSTNVAYSTPVGIAAVANAGYHFTGWSVVSGTGISFADAGAASTTVTLTSGSATIQANFAINTYTLSVQAGLNGSITAPSGGSAIVNHGASTTITATASSGYHFAGWSVVSGTGASFADAGAASTTVTLTGGSATIQATFIINTYLVIYDGNGSTNGSVPVDSVNYVQSQTVTVLGNTGNLVKTGYSYNGWNTVANGSGTTYTQGQTLAMGSANVTLYAKWTNNPTYTVTYDGNGNTSGSVPIDSTNYEQGQSVSVLGSGTIVKTGCTFLGWNTAANGSGTTYTQGQTLVMSTSNVTLWAKWTISQYTVTFDSQGGSAVTAQMINSGGTVTEPTAPTKTYFIFAGWYKEAACTNAWVFVSDTVTGNMTLYAKWNNQYNLRDTGPAGGLIFYINPNYVIDNWRYLEAAPNDQGIYDWWNGYWVTTGASGTAIGTGKTNTATIVAMQGAGTYAAKTCDDYTLGIFSDWFFPSKDELNQMHVNLRSQGVGSFVNDYYWSSSEEGQYMAFLQRFTIDGLQGDASRNYAYYVRAVRSF